MSFDRLAAHYDWLEPLLAGEKLQRLRTHWLAALAGRRKLLSVGEGHGRFAAACAARWPGLELTLLDASAPMLARARRRLPADARVRFVIADALTGPALDRHDALVTCFFLDCFPPEPLAEVVRRLATATTPDALWINVDFAVPDRGPARWRAQAVHALMYRFFRLATRLPARRLTSPDTLIAAQGFRLVGRFETEWGLLRADCWTRAAT